MQKNPTRRRRRRQIPSPPLGATIADQPQPGTLTTLTVTTAPPQMTRMPSPPRSSREVLNLLAAATGLVLAARPDAAVEWLPGTPTTVVITSNGKVEAAFVLPMEPGEVARTLGQTKHKHPDNMALMQLWQDDQQAMALTPEAALIAAEENWLSGGDHEG